MKFISRSSFCSPGFSVSHLLPCLYTEPGLTRSIQVSNISFQIIPVASPARCRVNQTFAFALPLCNPKKRIQAVEAPVGGRVNPITPFASMPHAVFDQSLTFVSMACSRADTFMPVCFNATRSIQPTGSNCFDATQNIQANAKICFNALQGMAAKRGFGLFGTPQQFSLLSINP